jgi:hypothetical protein
MSQPGARVRALAARLCNAIMMERLIDPIVADLQLEYDQAIRHGWTWRSRWLRVVGYVALLKAIALYGAERARRTFYDWTVDDHRGLGRLLGVSGAATALATFALMLPPLLAISSPRHWSVARLLFVMPQALIVAVPLGFTIGIFWALGGRSVSGRLSGTVIVLAIACSIASWVMLAWVVPIANQAFRVSVFGGAPMRGAYELTLGELKQLLEPGTHEPMALLKPSDMRFLGVVYHTRWALSFATLAQTIFALSVITRRRCGRAIDGVTACGALVMYSLLIFVGTKLGLDGTLPAVVGAWLPNAVCILVSATVVTFLSRHSSSAVHTWLSWE